MRNSTLVVALLLAGCAAPATFTQPAASTPAAPSPAQEELARLEAEFRRGDQEVGDQMAENPPPVCYRLDRLLDSLGPIINRICELSTTRDERHSHPGVPCRYARQRGAALSQQARKLGCRREKMYDPMPRMD